MDEEAISVISSGNTSYKERKSRYQKFLFLFNFAWLPHSVPHILFGIVWKIKLFFITQPNLHQTSNSPDLFLLFQSFFLIFIKNIEQSSCAQISKLMVLWRHYVPYLVWVKNWVSALLFIVSCGRNRPEVFCIKVVLKNFANFTGKHLCQSLIFNKVAGLRPALLKKRLWHKCFPVNFAKFLKTRFFMEHLWGMLL